MDLLFGFLGVLVSSWFYFQGLKNNKTTKSVAKTRRIHELNSFLEPLRILQIFLRVLRGVKMKKPT